MTITYAILRIPPGLVAIVICNDAVISAIIIDEASCFVISYYPAGIFQVSGTAVDIAFVGAIADRHLQILSDYTAYSRVFVRSSDACHYR